jgi:hypothetical protein
LNILTSLIENERVAYISRMAKAALQTQSNLKIALDFSIKKNELCCGF